MKKISVIALLSMLVMPVFAQQETSLASKEESAEVAPVSEQVKTSEEIKNEIKAELKQEYLDAKKTQESKRNFFDGFQIGVGVSGSSGLNGFVGYANKDFDSFWAKRFGIRFDFATTKPIKSALNDAVNEVMGDEIEIGDNLAISDLDIDANHYAAMIDFYPFGDTWLLGGWRISGGYYMGEFQASANIAGTISELDGGSYEFELMGHQFKYTGNSVNGTATLDWDYRGPYLGTGFDIGLIAGFKIYMDAGVVFTNKSAQLGLDLPFENLYMDGAPVDNQTIKDTVNSIVDETLADAQSELDDYKFYPMFKVGFMYRF